jgi:hypothetical protein
MKAFLAMSEKAGRRNRRSAELVHRKQKCIYFLNENKKIGSTSGKFCICIRKKSCGCGLCKRDVLWIYLASLQGKIYLF